MKTARERPILFSAPMVRAILLGQKTQTRRIVKPQPAESVYRVSDIDGHLWLGTHEFARRSETKCPFGIAGDRVWVREAFQYVEAYDGDGIAYRADDRILEIDYSADDAGTRVPVGVGVELHDVADCPWRPSIHMPRWASRIILEVTDVRVERLHEISEADAKAEGMALSELVEMQDGSPCYTTPFQEVWRSLHGIDNQSSWDANPWVWVVEFTQISNVPEH